jgi:hypothetical protein
LEVLSKTLHRSLITVPLKENARHITKIINTFKIEKIHPTLLSFLIILFSVPITQAKKIIEMRIEKIVNPKTT